MYNELITYKNIVIRSATTKDAKTLANWWNDGKVMAHAGFPNGLFITTERIIEQINSNDGKHRLIIEIDNLPIGEMSYHELINKNVEIGIKICDFTKQNQGYGKVIISMLIDYLFNEDYQKIVLDTNLKNKRAQHVYERIGFQKVKVNINSWKNQLGELESSVDYELTKDRFNSFINEK